MKVKPLQRPRERGLIVTGDLIPMILDGTKTQTRRLFKAGDPQAASYQLNVSPHGYHRYNPQYGSMVVGTHHTCPYGQPGDTLYVRETCAPIRIMYDHESGLADDTPPASWGEVLEYNKNRPLYKPTFSIAYAADEYWEESLIDRGFKWTPSIHMPREAARIILQVKKVSVERIQDITEEDARAEGAPVSGNHLTLEQRAHNYNNPSTAFPYSHRQGFKELWNSIYGKRWDLNPWDSNPWVWAITFELISKAT